MKLRRLSRWLRMNVVMGMAFFTIEFLVLTVVCFLPSAFLYQLRKSGFTIAEELIAVFVIFSAFVGLCVAVRLWAKLGERVYGRGWLVIMSQKFGPMNRFWRFLISGKQENHSA